MRVEKQAPPDPSIVSSAPFVVTVRRRSLDYLGIIFAIPKRPYFENQSFRRCSDVTASMSVIGYWQSQSWRTGGCGSEARWTAPDVRLRDAGRRGRVVRRVVELSGHGFGVGSTVDSSDEYGCQVSENRTDA